MTKEKLVQAYYKVMDLEDEVVGRQSKQQKKSTHNKNKINSNLKKFFENTNETKHIFSKYLLVRNFLAFIIFVNIVLSLCLYEYIAIKPDYFPWPA